jgi:hypothetical protein
MAARPVSAMISVMARPRGIFRECPEAEHVFGNKYDTPGVGVDKSLEFLINKHYAFNEFMSSIFCQPFYIRLNLATSGRLSRL